MYRTVFCSTFFLWTLAIVQDIISQHPAFAFSSVTVVGYGRTGGRIRASSLHESSAFISSQKQQVVAEFVSKVETAVQEQTFASLTLRGVKKPKSSKNPREAAAALRGSIRQVQGRLIHVKNAQILLQLTLKYHGATDICKNIGISEIQDALSELIVDPKMASEWGMEAVQTKPMQGAELKTLSHIYDLQQIHTDKPKLIQRKVNSKTKTDDTRVLAHDREKNLPLSRKADFLQALGLTKLDGKPKPGMKSKLNQCQKFVEIVSGLVNKIVEDDSNKPISVIDMGCGRGYLTFSLHSYLVEHYASVESKGIDVRPKLVAEISSIAKSLGEKFDTLLFEEGTIETFVGEQKEKKHGKEDDAIGILIALHACDTATDDALWSGICSGADLIVVAPCCHKQIRPQLDSHYVMEGPLHPLADVLKHGVYRERIAETVSDSLRALLLESAGYRVQVFEFIGGEHTSKNVMITAVKSNSQEANGIQERIKSLAKLHGIHKQKLAEWMEIDLGVPKQKTKSMANQMPPLE